jgi:hypothetical protein
METDALISTFEPEDTAGNIVSYMLPPNRMLRLCLQGVSEYSWKH